MIEITVRLTNAEAATLAKRDTRYRAGEKAKGEPTVVVTDRGPTINWPHGVRKSKARLSAEAKILAAIPDSRSEGTT